MGVSTRGGRAGALGGGQARWVGGRDWRALLKGGWLLKPSMPGDRYPCRKPQ